MFSPQVILPAPQVQHNLLTGGGHIYGEKHSEHFAESKPYRCLKVRNSTLNLSRKDTVKGNGWWIGYYMHFAPLKSWATILWANKKFQTVFKGSSMYSTLQSCQEITGMCKTMTTTSNLWRSQQKCVGKQIITFLVL